MKLNKYSIAVACALILAGEAHADGATAYLPINLEPEMERQVERVLILADEPILKRPFAVALVELALPKACEVDKVLCEKVRKYLERYSRDYALTHASVTGSYEHGHTDSVVPNSHGMPVDSHDELSIQGYVQPNDYVLASAGAISYGGRTTPTGSMLSIGTNWAQLDIGYRDHWFSPMTDSSALISTETPSTPSITLSNYEPLTRLGFQYEFFLTRLTEQPILYQGVEAVGSPRLLGLQVSIEPFSGWSLGANRMLEYGGGAGLPSSARFLLRDFFKPSGLSQNQGNQQASYVSRFILPTKIPFAVYFQYAGEDNSDGGSYLLGNPSTSAGIDFPKIARHFDATYEISEWSNIWYVHNIFLSGMSVDRLVLGNWGADQRNFGDGVGARSMMLRIGWLPPFGGYLEERVRTLQNQTYAGYDTRTYSPALPAFPYYHYYDFDVRYSRPWDGMTVGGEVLAGRDVDGTKFTRLSAFVRYGGDSRTRDDDVYDDDDIPPIKDDHGGQVFIDVGFNANRVIANIEPNLPITTSSLDFGPHFGIGARRAVSANNDLGIRVEADQVDGHTLIGLRPIDYRYRFEAPIAIGAFAGVERWSLATPATSEYFGLGLQWLNILRGWDLDFEGRYGQNLARDHVLATDVQGVRPESFYKVETLALFVSRHF